MTGYLNISEDDNRKISFVADNTNEFLEKYMTIYFIN